MGGSVLISKMERTILEMISIIGQLAVLEHAVISATRTPNAHPTPSSKTTATSTLNPA